MYFTGVPHSTANAEVTAFASYFESICDMLRGDYQEQRGMITGIRMNRNFQVTTYEMTRRAMTLFNIKKGIHNRINA